MKKIIIISAVALFASGSAFAQQVVTPEAQTTAEKCAAVQANPEGKARALIELCNWIGQYR